jgi:ATP cone domain-containing protein
MKTTNRKRKPKTTKLKLLSKRAKRQKASKRTVSARSGSERSLRPKRSSISKNVKKTLHRRSPKREVLVQRSSGRRETFDTDRLAQTVSRSGVPYPMARDIAKKTAKKIKLQQKSSSDLKKFRKNKQKPVVVKASQMRNLVARELKERNRPDIARSYMGMSPEHVEHQIKPTLDDKEPILDNIAANRTKVLFDPSKQKGSS